MDKVQNFFRNLANKQLYQQKGVYLHWETGKGKTNKMLELIKDYYDKNSNKIIVVYSHDYDDRKLKEKIIKQGIDINIKKNRIILSGSLKNGCDLLCIDTWLMHKMEYNEVLSSGYERLIICSSREPSEQLLLDFDIVLNSCKDWNLNKLRSIKLERILK